MIPNKPEVQEKPQKEEKPYYVRPLDFKFTDGGNNPRQYVGCTILVTNHGDRITLANGQDNAIVVNRNGEFVGSFTNDYALSAFLNGLYVHPR